MSEETRDDDTVENVSGLFSPQIAIKAQLKKAKDYTDLDVSKFKTGKAYRIKGERQQAMLINAIVLNPTSAVPMAMGFLATPDSFMPYSTNLANLEPSEVFF